jgi:hypothetical protein
MSEAGQNWGAVIDGRSSQLSAVRQTYGGGANLGQIAGVLGSFSGRRFGGRLKLAEEPNSGPLAPRFCGLGTDVAWTAVIWVDRSESVAGLR